MARVSDVHVLPDEAKGISKDLRVGKGIRYEKGKKHGAGDPGRSRGSLGTGYLGGESKGSVPAE